MTDKEKFLELKSYEEFDKRREEFRMLKFDKDIVEHMSKIFPKSPNPPEELYRTRPYEQCKKCKNWKGYNGCGLYPGIFKEKPDLSDGKICSNHVAEGKGMNKKV